MNISLSQQEIELFHRVSHAFQASENFSRSRCVSSNRKWFSRNESSHLVANKARNSSNKAIDTMF